MNINGKKILFVINPGSGPDDKPWEDIIRNYFTEKPFETEIFFLSSPPDIEALTKKIKDYGADVTVAVGGDGTVTMVAKIVAVNDGVLGIIPGGSANGMAKELNIPLDPTAALDIITKGKIKSIDGIRVNGKNICLHLCDIGINAQLIKYFEEGKVRGKLGYAKMVIKTLYHKRRLTITLQSAGKVIKRDAFMVVLANASKYGTGAVINPKGLSDDGIFEVVIIRKLAISELLKMLFRPGIFNPQKIETLSATSVMLTSQHAAHFQIDGEYLGKVNVVQAQILNQYIKIALP